MGLNGRIYKGPAMDFDATDISLYQFAILVLYC